MQNTNKCTHIITGSKSGDFAKSRPHSMWWDFESKLFRGVADPTQTLTKILDGEPDILGWAIEPEDKEGREMVFLTESGTLVKGIFKIEEAPKEWHC